MNVSIASHAHRKLRRLHRYLPASKLVEYAPEFVAELPIRAEAIVGCYRNDGGLAHDWIVFTTDGISAKFDGSWRHILYADMIAVTRDCSKNIESDEIFLELRTRNSVTMIVNGKDVDRGTHDKYEIMMFIESVIAACE